MGVLRKLLIVASYLCIIAGITDSTLLETFRDGTTTYTIHYHNLAYKWNKAEQLCEQSESELAKWPFSEELLEKLTADYSLDGDVWISNEAGHCLGLRATCEEAKSYLFGGVECQEHSLGVMSTDCMSKKRYVICAREVETDYPDTSSFSPTPTQPTTQEFTTATSTTSTTTHQPTTTTKAPARITFPAPSTTRSWFPQPPAKTNQPSYPGNGREVNVKQDDDTHLAKFGHALIGISMGQKDLLGLAIGVVTGSCLIVVLLLVLCCACQGKKPIYNSKYDFESTERNSQHSLLKSGQSSSNNSSLDHPTRLTEESSIELSVAPSHSSKLCAEVPPKTYGYLPPPSIYNGALDESDISHYGEIGHQQQPTLQNSSRASSHSPKSVTYASIHKNRDSVLSEDLPPPPPPHRGYESDDDHETSIKGLNPMFKTFLNKTIAVQPQPVVSFASPTSSRRNHQGNFPRLSVDVSQLPPPPPPQPDNMERKGLITSDL